MMHPLPHLFLLFVTTRTSITTASSSVSSSHTFPAFAHHSTPPSSSRRTQRIHHPFVTTPTTLASKSSPTIEEIHAESEQLRQEIKELRAEALRRLEALEDMLSKTPRPEKTSTNDNAEESSSLIVVDAKLQEEGLLPAPPPIVIQKSNTDNVGGQKVRKSVANLLDGTTWKISLSIGREPGTWMPKTWGSNGQRLNLSFQAEFTPTQLYERDDFLRGGYSNAKVLRIHDNRVILGPSLTEGQRVYTVKTPGGWQITRGDGPMGTDLLRFYIELDEEVSHGDMADLYIPKGRVYCSCGYFPFLTSENRSGGGGGGTAPPSMKESYANELQSIEDQMEKLQEKRAEITNPFSLDGFKLSREIGKLQREAELVVDKLNYASVREPDRSLLKFSKDMDVGLTREGGVCCRVDKGPMVVEYHILGRFSIASVDLSDATK
ncbi:hypothetical protein HJC23_009412 [Cyclotella cryptica]|uniref:Plastid lipid-associated protein/fibrillin conserved domain-containing protein n=1 Tax=Cyclotella cryptica TaxID=29204 RepID=A0ABD3PX28_9STRA|eukprot:CCRYP_010599-RA/>CCRYP_010599-RA protein AED:0.06 eAED:0.06 QI:179/1/1/1/1/1/2/81/434